MEGIRMKMWLKKHAVGGVPSLLDLSVQAAIDNVRYMGDVGWTDIDLLGRILPHCKVDELKYIEDSTEGRDLSPVTDKLWKGFYKHEFGEESMNLVIKRMMSKNVTFKWRMLYEAKAKEREVAKKQSVDRLKQRYMEENDNSCCVGTIAICYPEKKKSRVDRFKFVLRYRLQAKREAGLEDLASMFLV